MTETEWLECQDSTAMLQFLWTTKVSDRKFRLFACACCRRIWHLLKDKRSQTGVQAAEHYLDQAISDDELFTAAQAAGEACNSPREPSACHAAHLVTYAPCTRDTFVRRYAGEAFWQRQAYASLAAVSVAYAIVAQGEDQHKYREVDPIADEEYSQQSRLLRDIVGPLPFRPVPLAFSPGPEVSRLAQAIYNDRAFDRLPILADALEDAGCTDPDILTHCRGLGPHVRGCWVVDLLLGRS